MSTIVLVLHVFVCLILMLVVLLQPGKGGGMGAAFGGGSSSGTVFGGSGASGFLRKLTVGVAATFMLTSMTLAWIASTSGADALARYSAQQRLASELRDDAHREATGADPETAPDGDTQVILPEGEGEGEGASEGVGEGEGAGESEGVGVGEGAGEGEGAGAETP